MSNMHIEAHYTEWSGSIYFCFDLHLLIFIIHTIGCSLSSTCLGMRRSEVKATTSNSLSTNYKKNTRRQKRADDFFMMIFWRNKVDASIHKLRAIPPGGCTRSTNMEKKSATGMILEIAS